MKYWSWLILKLLAAGALLPAVWIALRSLLPKPKPFLFTNLNLQPMGHDLAYTFAALCFGLFCVGVFVLILLDQRYRCPQCARRLRMPLKKGSFDQVLLAPPRIEYICTYGHGTLKVAEVQITGLQIPDWVPNRDIWTELEHLEETTK